ncbi:MAG: hypothetical protein ABI390_04895 [Daejeonella sp.]
MIKILTSPLSIVVILLLTTSNIIFAQDSTETSDRSIAGQYQEILQKSKNNDQGFKIVNPSRLQSYHRSVLDSLNSTNSALTLANAKVVSQAKSIRTISKELNASRDSLNKSENLNDSMNFIGIPMEKSTYRLIMWGMVILLAAVLAFTLFRSTSYRKEARYRIKLYDELFEEHQSYKVKANEKEKKLARELQTEKNRVEELLSR